MDQPPITNRGPGETEAGNSNRSPDASVRLNFEQLQTQCAKGLKRQAGNLVLLTQMIRKPRLVGLWLWTARAAQVATLAGILLVIFVGRPTADWITQRLYPTEYETQRFFQRFTGNRTAVDNPLRETRREQILMAAWVAVSGAGFLLLLSNVPRAVAIGRRRANDLLAKAEGVAEEDLVTIAKLRTTAEGLVIKGQPFVEAAGSVTEEPTRLAPKRSVAGKTRSKLTPTHTPNPNPNPNPNPSSDPSAKSNLSANSRSPSTESNDTDAMPRYVGADRRYRLAEQMGGGGMGVVHAATDMLLDRRVALKQLYAQFVGDHEHSMRFRQEAMALASLAHPHIVTMHDLIEFDSHFWIVMELLTGGSLADRIAASGRLPVADAVQIAIALASALDYAHGHGIVHRDVKPMNVLFTDQGIPKLADFGTAKLRESWVHTCAGDMLGSPAFMSPEQITGSPVDPRTDVYCLGITLYQMLTGGVPFDGDISSILAQHVNRAPDPPGSRNPDVSASLDAVVLKMLAKSPDDRFQSCQAAIEALHGTGH